MRVFFKAREETSTMNQFFSILRYLPDGVLICDLEEPLYLNKKAK